MQFGTNITTALAFAGFTAAGATMPGFSFQPSDMLRTNQIITFTRPQTKYAARFWITTEAQARLQRFANCNLGKDVVLNYGCRLHRSSPFRAPRRTKRYGLHRLLVWPVTGVCVSANVCSD